MIRSSVFFPFGVDFFHSRLESQKHFFKRRSRAGKVYALEASSVLAENLAVIKVDMIFDKELFHLLMVKPGFSHIKPEKVGSLKLYHFDFFKVFRHEILDKIGIALDYRQKLVEPFVALCVCGNARGIGKNIETHMHIKKSADYGFCSR